MSRITRRTIIPVNQITPLTYRDGVTYIQMLTQLSEYVKGVLHPSLQHTVDQVVADVEAQMDKHHDQYVDGVQEFQRIHDAFMSDVNAHLIALNDGAVSDLVDDTESLLRNRLDSVYVDRNGLHIDPSSPEFGGVPDANINGGGTDSTEALQAAINKAQSARTFVNRDVARRIHLNGFYKFTRDLHLTDSSVVISGDGANTGLIGVNAGLVLDGRDGLVSYQGLQNLRLRRVTTAGQSHGTALLIDGGRSGGGNYPVRWHLNHVWAESPVHPSGTNPERSISVRMRGTFLATVTQLYPRMAHTGLVIEGDEEVGNLSANAVAFFGGEIQAVDHIGRIDRAIGIQFYGMAWEGAQVGGMDINGSSGILISGPYLEANWNYDIRIGNESFCGGVTIQGATSSVGALPARDGGMDNKRSIVAHSVEALNISGYNAAGYDDSPILLDDRGVNRITGNTTAVRNSRGALDTVENKSRHFGAVENVSSVTMESAGNALVDITTQDTNRLAGQIVHRPDGTSHWFSGVTAGSYRFGYYDENGVLQGYPLQLTGKRVRLDDADIQLPTNAGEVTNAALHEAPREGNMVVDNVNHRLYIRSGGSWRYVNLQRYEEEQS